MPKWMNINPDEFLGCKDLNLGSIPAMKYASSLADEIKDKNLSKNDAIEIYKEMYWIRLYESFLDEIKIEEEYQHENYN